MNKKPNLFQKRIKTYAFGKDSVFSVFDDWLMVGGAGEEAGDPEEDHGTYYGGDEVADYAGGSDAEEAEEPAAEHASDDSYH